MDHRSWLWKKKTSDKAITEKNVDALDFPGADVASNGSARVEAKLKKPNYAKKSRESYTDLTSLEHQVMTLGDEIKIWRDEVKDLSEKLCAAHLEMTAKDSIVKQHSKVAEEAVSGWEKSDAENIALKSQLESVTLAKLTAEGQASHLNSALIECMMQVRLVKEDHEQLLHDAILTKTKQWDLIKLDLEGQMADLDHRLLGSAAENAALSRSLLERSDMLMTISELKSHVEVQNEVLRGKIQDYEKEKNSLKYEMHILTKEIEIRKEEKTMSMKLAEAANNQHLEGIRKIAKLEAECQRLRGLVRKKLPGPVALAQMKQESAYLGRDVAGPQERRPPVKNSRSQSSSVAKFSTNSLQPSFDKSEFLKTRLLVVEEETKMLKEALTTQNSEMNQVGIQNQRRSLPRTIEMPTEGSSSLHENCPQSVASMSDDGLDEDGSYVGSWIQSISSYSHLSRDKSSDKIELMDDFLEMERLACSPSSSTKFTI